VVRLFQSWRWSWKIPIKHQLLKYTSHNTLLYYNFLVWFNTTPWRNIKFLDEVHFVSKDVIFKKCLGPINKRIMVINNLSLDERLTTTCLTTPQRFEKPLEIWTRNDSNTQWDFMKFILHCIEHGALVSGDYLVVDNASVHAGLDSYPILESILKGFGLKLVFLPTYSPELDPVELVFAFVKNFLRHYRKSTDDLLQSIVVAFSQISSLQILKMYAHCSKL